MIFVVILAVLVGILIGRKIWVFQWFDTASIEGGIGETFNQNLIAAEAKGKIISKYFNELC